MQGARGGRGGGSGGGPLPASLLSAVQNASTTAQLDSAMLQLIRGHLGQHLMGQTPFAAADVTSIREAFCSKAPLVGSAESCEMWVTSMSALVMCNGAGVLHSQAVVDAFLIVGTQPRSSNHVSAYMAVISDIAKCNRKGHRDTASRTANSDSALFCSAEARDVFLRLAARITAAEGVDTWTNTIGQICSSTQPQVVASVYMTSEVHDALLRLHQLLSVSDPSGAAVRQGWTKADAAQHWLFAIGEIAGASGVCDPSEATEASRAFASPELIKAMCSRPLTTVCRTDLAAAYWCQTFIRVFYASGRRPVDDPDGLGQTLKLIVPRLGNEHGMMGVSALLNIVSWANISDADAIAVCQANPICQMLTTLPRIETIGIRMQGNQHFAAKRFEDAISVFTKAIDKDRKSMSNAATFSNRAACYCELHRFTEALADAEECIALKPEWFKGYVRKASALEGLGGAANLEAAIAAMELGKGLPSAQQHQEELAERITKLKVLHDEVGCDE